MGVKKTITIGAGLAVVLIGALVFFGGNLFAGNGPEVKAADIIIDKSEVTGQAKFFPYQAGNTAMEVMAVKAPDGTVRTAFNTCQVCFSSGRGFYVQEDDELVCQNCGNRFNVSDVEVVRGGCNPVPIVKENKTEDEKKS